MFGGEIIHAEVLPYGDLRQRHAWNQLSSGVEIDLTCGQFSLGEQFRPCDLPAQLVWEYGGKQAELLLARVLRRIAVDSEIHPAPR
jgi:hypothetical protein